MFRASLCISGQPFMAALLSHSSRPAVFLRVRARHCRGTSQYNTGSGAAAQRRPSASQHRPRRVTAPAVPCRQMDGAPLRAASCIIPVRHARRDRHPPSPASDPHSPLPERGILALAPPSSAPHRPTRSTTASPRRPDPPPPPPPRSTAACSDTV